MNVDLDKRNVDEKEDILKSLMKKYSVSGKKADRLYKLQKDLLKYGSGCIGFPALISWVCKQPIEENVEELLNNPLQSISNKIESLKNSLDVNEKAKYYILAYMSFKDGKMKRNDFDNTFFDTLKNLYDEQFEYKNLKKYARSMVGYYLAESKKCCFELDSTIIQKIVLVSVARDHAAFFSKTLQGLFQICYFRKTLSALYRSLVCRMFHFRLVNDAVKCKHRKKSSFQVVLNYTICVNSQDETAYQNDKYVYT